MTIGTVNATSLNLRDSAGGSIIGYLPRGAAVTLTDDAAVGEWVHVSTVTGTPTTSGWVSSKFLTIQGRAAPSTDSPAAPSLVPPADDADSRVTVSGNNALGPDGKPFARLFKGGLFTAGLTSLSAWLAPGGSAGTPSASVVRVVRAVSANEGRLEAVNSYDNAHLSFGMFQWTAGAGDDPGELAGLLNVLKQVSPTAFQDCFGRYGLDVEMASANAVTGNLRLAGQVLGASADKEQLRRPEWAYRFWRSGHFDGVRQAELTLAASRIGRFADTAVNGFTVRQWLSSEHGIALILDEHVNRPGHVPGTLGQAITALQCGDPTAWTAQDEATLIDRYIQERAGTNMTDSDGRAGRIADSVRQGALSEDRGSFTG